MHNTIPTYSDFKIPLISDSGFKFIESVSSLYPEDIKPKIETLYLNKAKKIFSRLKKKYPDFIAAPKAIYQTNVWYREVWKDKAKGYTAALAMNDDDVIFLAKKITSTLTRRSINISNKFDNLDDGLPALNNGKVSRGANRAAQKFIIRWGLHICKGLSIPHAKGGFDSASARYLDVTFWIRKLRRAIYPVREDICRTLQMINKKTSPYSSKAAQEIRNSQLAKAANWSENMLAINPTTGEPISMKAIIDCAYDSYKSRIIAKASGLKNLQKENNWKSAMVTITCPGGFRAGKKHEQSIQGCIEYLRTTNKQINEEARKQGLKIAGLQVFQPHKDGTPHQHIYIIGSESDIISFYEIVKSRAWKTKAGDRQKYIEESRTKLDWEDSDKGSLCTYALSYVLKLSTKESEEVAGDEKILLQKEEYEQEPACEKNGSAEDAFYALNRIRRIGWIGLPDDYAWEACRKVSEKRTQHSAELSEASKAAKAGDYAEWTSLMGGICVKSKDRPYKSITVEKIDKYGDTYKQYIGAELFGISIILKGNSWSLVAGVNMNYPRGERSPEEHENYDDFDEIICLWEIPEPIPI